MTVELTTPKAPPSRHNPRDHTAQRQHTTSYKSPPAHKRSPRNTKKTAPRIPSHALLRKKLKTPADPFPPQGVEGPEIVPPHPRTGQTSKLPISAGRTWLGVMVLGARQKSTES